MTNLLLYQRIAQQLADDIRRGVYQPGERVPSVRKMSAQLNVSHATVLQAYANLEDQGLSGRGRSLAITCTRPLP